MQRVLSGHGRVANDMYGVLDRVLPDDFPQREQDIEQAMALLAEAGQEGLDDRPVRPGRHRRPARAGRRVRRSGQGGRRHGQRHRCSTAARTGATSTRKRTFATSFWGTRPYLNQVGAGQPADGDVPRDPLAAGGQQLRGALPAGARRDRRRRRAARSSAQMQHAGVRGGRVHHPLLQQPARRPHHAGARVSSPAERAQPRPLRPWLQEHLARELTPGRVDGRRVTAGITTADRVAMGF